MKILKDIKRSIRVGQQQRAQRAILSRFSGTEDEIARSQWEQSLNAPTEFYERCFHYFHANLPELLREHRFYFEAEGRGFGERSFHVMWFLLFREFKPESFLEIGIFRGQTLSFAALLGRHLNLQMLTQGVSPFSPAGDSVSIYGGGVDYYEDTLKNFAHFSLPAPQLLKAFSTDKVAVELIASRDWAFIYIDGNHDYEIALADWNLCSAHLLPGGVIVLDDSGLTTKYKPPIFATGGHPGPSRLAQEIDRSRFREILQVGHNRVFQKIA
jgi:Methyltransferase domain